MFCGNWIFDINGEMEHLPKVIELALDMDSGLAIFTRADDPVHVARRILSNGTYAIGCGGMDSDSESDKAGRSPDWTDFPLPFDPKAIARDIELHLARQPYHASDEDGLVRRGFRCRAFEPDMLRFDPNLDWEEDDFMEAIAVFTPCNIEYPK